MEIKTHPGIVLSTQQGRVEVQIESHSACSACEAHSKCGFADSKNKTLLIDTPDWDSYREGQQVTVQISEGLGLQAVLWAYLLPAVLMLGVIVTLLLVGVSEMVSILVTLGVLAVYCIGLYAVRDKLQRHFTVTISDE